MESICVKVHSILDIKKILGKGEVEVSVPQGSTLIHLLDVLVHSWGKKLRARLFEPDGERLLSTIRLMVNGRDIAFLNGVDTVLQEGDEVLILQPVAGG